MVRPPPPQVLTWGFPLARRALIVCGNGTMVWCGCFNDAVGSRYPGVCVFTVSGADCEQLGLLCECECESSVILVVLRQQSPGCAHNAPVHVSGIVCT